MTGQELASNFARLESHLSASKGDFTLFALSLREDLALDRWDLLVAAPWLPKDYDAAIQYMVDEIRSFLGPEILIPLSRIIVADPYDPAVRAFNTAIHAEHGLVEVRDTIFFGLPVKRAYIITSKLQEAPVA